MKLSGHNFQNAVFNSLLDGLSKDRELKKSAQSEISPDITQFFSSTTAKDLAHIYSEEMDFIANELSFAANKAKISITSEDLAKFASQVNKDHIRGKKLERAAQKYCNNLNREIASPQGTTRTSASDLIDNLANYKITPAGDNPNYGVNNSVTGKFMGSSKNPNTIWDTNALQHQSQIALGDEKIKESQKSQKEYKLSLKTAQWQEHQDKCSKSEQITKSISNTGISNNDELVNQKLPANSMSIFSNDRDFENIPERTDGELIIAQAEARANKRKVSENEERDIQRPMNTKDSLALWQGNP